MTAEQPQPPVEVFGARETLPTADPAVLKLHALSEMGPDSYYNFLSQFQTSTNPNIERFYGSPSSDRLERLQYNIDRNFIRVPGSELLIPVNTGTWGSDVEFGAKEDRRLNEDAVLTVPFGNGRVLAAVFDGASSQRPISGLDKDGVKGAWMVSHLASVKWPESEIFKKLSEDPQTSAQDVMVELNNWLRGELSGVEGVDYGNVLFIPGMAATLAIIDRKRGKIQISHAADTMALAEYDDHYEILTNNDNGAWDEETQSLVDEIVEEYKRKGIKVTYLQASKDARVAEQLARSFSQKINTAETPEHRKGTGIVNGMPELVTNGLIHTAEIDIPTTGGFKLHLLSDGVYSAWTNRRDLTEESGVRKLLGALNTPSYMPGNAIHDAFVRLKLDPDAETIRRIIKAHDDASRLTLTINPGDEYSQFGRENQQMLWRDYAEISDFIAAQQKAA